MATQTVTARDGLITRGPLPVQAGTGTHPSDSIPSTPLSVQACSSPTLLISDSEAHGTWAGDHVGVQDGAAGMTRGIRSSDRMPTDGAVILILAITGFTLPGDIILTPMAAGVIPMRLDGVTLIGATLITDTRPCL